MQVELQHISKRFGPVQANDDVSVTIAAGSIHGLLGENGAGKSTLVKILSGFITHDRGEILLNGKSIPIQTPAEAIRRGIGMLHQDPLDFPPLTVLDNFMMGKTGGLFLNARTALREFRDLAAQFNFRLDGQAQLSELTVGERQQVEILRLLSLGVNTLVLDEPTTGISASQKTALFEAMKQLAAQGKSVIFVSHKLEDVEELCDRVTVMRQGQVAGHLDIIRPIPPDLATRLVDLMFGRELSMPAKPATFQEETALEFQGISLKTDRLTLTVDRLTVRRGEVIGLAGLEGSGQQLLLQLCAGLLHPVQGQLKIEGTEMAHKPYQAFLDAGVSYVPADRLKEGLIRGLSIQEHVALRHPNPGFLIDWREITKLAQQAIGTFSIRGRPSTLVERLSGGNQQRTQLALMPVPLTLLLMEHPTRGLDIESTLWVWQQLIARCETGTTILFISSDLDEIVQYSDRVMVFSGGRMSDPIPVQALTADKLGQMIGGRFE
ncbi:MAG: ATP-binding cassette domain-containing protein [Leptolyngbyaceae cyanobacterium bins.59]|nr:ATP-binding cassette domain-containing protein [Leptolyngbyaceae cyanobacterium bins.59]